MCLAIPARLVEYIDDERMYGKVELGGVMRRINTSLLVGEDATEPGEYVLVHVGFALSRVSETEAAETLRILEEMGPAYTDEVQQIREWQAMEEELVGANYRNGNGGVARMKFADEFRDADLASALAARIAGEAGDRHWKIMEVCGGHTHTIFKYGIEDLLPSNVELVHGPGCPVCVIPMGRLDDGIAVAKQPGVIFTCFGDLMRVPGSDGSLLDAKAAGADVRMVYSPLDALKIAHENPSRQVVFYAIGFETTAPSTALTLMRAKAEGLRNLFVFCNHVTIIPPMKAILDSPDLQLDGFLGPGHVSTVVGIRPFEFVTRTYDKPVVVVGFEPLDILQGVHMIIRQVLEGRCEVENQYKRVVHDDGNPKALEVLARVFKLRSHFEWRGLGFISQSALELQDEFADFDAEKVFSVPGVRVADPKACQCGEVLKGVLKPWECKVFGTACTPETPIGTCMVSSEGACAAYYNFGRYSRARDRERVLAAGERSNGNGHSNGNGNGVAAGLHPLEVRAT